MIIIGVFFFGKRTTCSVWLRGPLFGLGPGYEGAVGHAISGIQGTDIIICTNTFASLESASNGNVWLDGRPTFFEVFFFL